MPGNEGFLLQIIICHPGNQNGCRDFILHLRFAGVCFFLPGLCVLSFAGNIIKSLTGTGDWIGLYRFVTGCAESVESQEAGSRQKS